MDSKHANTAALQALQNIINECDKAPWFAVVKSSPCIAEARAVLAAGLDTPDLLEALIEERRLRLLGQEPDVHWESLRDMRRAAYAATDTAIAKATGAQQ